MIVLCGSARLANSVQWEVGGGGGQQTQGSKDGKTNPEHEVTEPGHRGHYHCCC